MLCSVEMSLCRVNKGFSRVAPTNIDLFLRIASRDTWPLIKLGLEESGTL